jgi:hypothetical protein
MKKVLFISALDKDSMMITYLKPYMVNRGYDIIKDDRVYQSPVFNWSEKKERLIENIEGYYSFKFKDIDIDYKITKNIGYGMMDENFSFAKEQIEKFGYDKVYLFVREFFANGFDTNQHKSPNLDIMEVIYLNVNEAFHETDDRILDFLNSNKIISSGAFGHTHKNLYYEPFLNLLYFYYIYGFDFLSYKYLKIDKDNLIGLYLKKNYKPERDVLYSEIKNRFIESDIDSKLLEIYDTTGTKPTFLTELITIHNQIGWEKNHYSTYTDYLASVCAFLFETTNHKTFGWPSDSKNRQYITEKTLKAILFSKLNIPFITDMNPYNFLELHNMGFWFMNTEFFDFNKIHSDDEISDNFKNSIDKSIEHVLNLYKKNDSDLNKTRDELERLYSDKMQNNFNQFMQYLERPKNNDKLIEFILYGKGN